MKLFRSLATALLLCTALSLAQTDQYIASGSASPYLTLGRGLIWGGAGLGTVGQNFIFNPLDPNQGFCVFIFNNNTTSAHTFTLTVAQTGDPAIRSYSGNTQRWTNVPTQSSFPISVPANSLLGINYKTTASAGIVISFTGNTTQAGSPDTADIFTVQTNQSSCGSLPVNSVQGPFQQNATVTLAQQFPVLVGGVTSPGSTGSAQTAHMGTTGNGWLIDGGVCCQAFASGFQSNPASNLSNLKTANGASTELETVIDNFSMGFVGAKGTAAGLVATNFLEAATNQFYLTASNTPAWVVLGKLTNPATGATLLSHFLTNASAVNAAYKSLYISCSAACELLVTRTTARGTTCTALTPQNEQIGNNGVQLAPVAADVSENACTGAPTASTSMYDLNIAAGSTTNIDLTGTVNFHNAAGNGSGIQVQVVTGITGVATASLTWMEQ